MASELETRVLRKITYRIVPVHHAAVLHRVHRSREHRLCFPDDEQGSRLLSRRFRLRRRHLLPRILPVRGALEPDPRKGRRPHLDRPGDDHLGPHLRRHGLRPGIDQLLHPPLPPGGRRGRLLPRHHPVSQLLVPGPQACRRDGALHGRGTAVDGARLADLRRPARDARPPRPCRLAVDVPHRGRARGDPRRRRAVLHDRSSREGEVAGG